MIAFFPLKMKEILSDKCRWKIKVVGTKVCGNSIPEQEKWNYVKLSNKGVNFVSLPFEY